MRPTSAGACSEDQVTILPPQRLADALQGDGDEQARRLALYDRMAELQFLTFDIRRTLQRGVRASAKTRGAFSRAAVEDPLSAP